jgi:8-amino-7-oxononanoate synthase
MNYESLHDALAQLRSSASYRKRRLLAGPQGARISLDGKPVLSFASNDYLGLANHSDLIQAATEALSGAGLGAGASHLLTGHHGLHQTAEQALAAYVGMPDALLFSTGYMANLAVVTSLLGRQDAIFADKLNHSSLVDAAILSRASHDRYRHADLDHLDYLLKRSAAATKLIASDAVFSMDGDIAPVNDLMALAERHGAWLFLDDAHGIGVLGETGRGTLEHAGWDVHHRQSPRIVYMATLGKAMGIAGAFVAGSHDLMDWLVNKARTYIYTTAMPPALAAAVPVSLGLSARDAWRRERLHAHISRLRAGCAGLPWRLLESPTPIQPLLIGQDDEALRVSARLEAHGIFVPAIRPPTVPKGTARLRISLSAAHEAEDIDALVGVLRKLADG